MKYNCKKTIKMKEMLNCQVLNPLFLNLKLVICIFTIKNENNV